MDDQALKNLRKDERRYNISIGGFIVTGFIAVLFLVLGLLQIRRDFIEQISDLKDENRQQIQAFAETVEENRQKSEDYRTCILFVNPEDRDSEILADCRAQAEAGVLEIEPSLPDNKNNKSL